MISEILQLKVKRALINKKNTLYKALKESCLNHCLGWVLAEEQQNKRSQRLFSFCIWIYSTFTDAGEMA